MLKYLKKKPFESGKRKFILEYSSRLFYFILLFFKYAPLGDLSSNIGEAGLGELYSKRVAAQVAAALGYIHSKVTYLSL